jgi:hypothetical protein
MFNPWLILARKFFYFEIVKFFENQNKFQNFKFNGDIILLKMTQRKKNVFKILYPKLKIRSPSMELEEKFFSSIFLISYKTRPK